MIKYVNPEMEVISVEVEDVILASNEIPKLPEDEF